MKLNLSIAVGFLSLFLFGQSAEPYYAHIDFQKTGDEMKTQLSTLITNTHTREVTYNELWDILKVADEDPENPKNVLLVYGSESSGKHQRSRVKSGSWNREHVFSRSKGTPNLGEEGAGSDAHHLRPADIALNSTRSNSSFDDGTGVFSYKTNRGGWYPGDEWKGDVARTIMYLYLRYPTQAIPTNIGLEPMTYAADMPDIFLKWNVEDPVSPYEIKRNNYVASVQHNRNPFVDNPYLATIIWGGPDAENRWPDQISGGTSGDKTPPSVPESLHLVSVTEHSITFSWNTSNDDVRVSGYHLYVDGEYVEVVYDNKVEVKNLKSNTTYSLAVRAFDSSQNKSDLSQPLVVKTEGSDLPDEQVCGEEDFEKVPISAGYHTRSWENNGIEWVATDTRVDKAAYIDGNGTHAVCIRDGSLKSSTISKGISSLTVQTQLKFNGSNGAYILLINGEEKGEIPYSSEPETYTINNINVEGDFTIEIVSDIASNRVSFDNLSWTCNDSGNMGTTESDVAGSSLKIYPNPIKGYEFYIDGLEHDETIYVYHMNGMMVQTIKNVKNKQKITLNQLPKGVYMIKTRKETIKVLIE